MKLLSISTDQKIFERGSAVALRQIEYAKGCEEMHIVVFAPRGFQEISLAPNCFVYPTRSWTRFMYPLDATRLGRFIVERRGITNITCQDSSFTAMVGINLKRQFGLPLELQVHTDIGSKNFTYSSGNKLRKAMALSYIPKADHIRVVSRRVKEYLVGTLGVSDSKVEIRPIRVDVEAVKNAPIVSDLHSKYPQFDKIVLMASRLTSEKNIELAIRSWTGVVATYPTVGLVIIGSGPMEKSLRNLANKLGLAENVIFESWADRGTLYSYYKTADVFLNTSRFEGYGMTLVEAKSAGCYTISTDVGVAREIGVNVIEIEDVAHIAKMIISALSS